VKGAVTHLKQPDTRMPCILYFTRCLTCLWEQRR